MTARDCYVFPVLPVGHYELQVQAPGFSGYQRTDVVLDTNGSLTIDALPPVAESPDRERGRQYAARGNHQHANRTGDHRPTDDGGSPQRPQLYRSALSAARRGSSTSITSTTVQDVGATVLNVSGTLNPGTISVNGQREFANYFSVNGADAEEDVNAGTAIIPNLDAIDEFRIITSNFDAEYGEFSGGQINVVTKSGTNRFHGNVFEFLRNTDLDARNISRPPRRLPPEPVWGHSRRSDPPRPPSSSSPTIRERGRHRASIPAPSAFPRRRSNREISSTCRAACRRGGRPVFRQPAHPETRLPGHVRRIVLRGGMRELRAVRLSERHDSAERLVGSGTAVAAIHPGSQYPHGYATSAFNQIVRDDKGAVRVDANTRLGCSPAITSSTTSISMTLIRWCRAAPAFLASTPSPPAGRSSSRSVIPGPSAPRW